MQMTWNWRKCLFLYFLFTQYHGYDMKINPNRPLGFPDVARQGVSFISNRSYICICKGYILQFLHM
mgnify:CR=1 FL=1